MHLQRAFLTIFALAAICLNALAPGQPAEESKPVPGNPDPKRFAKEIEAFEAADREKPPAEGGILFVGSSSTRLWDLEKSFPGLGALNRGFGGSHLSDAIHYADRIVLKYRPRLIVLYAGDNDIAEGKSATRVFEDYRGFVEIVRRALPATKIVYIPIKPSRARWSLWSEMGEANARIRRYAEDDALLFCADTATPMLENESPPPADLFVEDGLHLSAKGYALWTEIVRATLESAGVATGAKPAEQTR